MIPYVRVLLVFLYVQKGVQKFAGGFPSLISKPVGLKLPKSAENFESLEVKSYFFSKTAALYFLVKVPVDGN